MSNNGLPCFWQVVLKQLPGPPASRRYPPLPAAYLNTCIPLSEEAVRSHDMMIPHRNGSPASSHPDCLVSCGRIEAQPHGFRRPAPERDPSHRTRRKKGKVDLPTPVICCPAGRPDTHHAARHFSTFHSTVHRPIEPWCGHSLGTGHHVGLCTLVLGPAHVPPAGGVLKVLTGWWMYLAAPSLLALIAGPSDRLDSALSNAVIKPPWICRTQKTPSGTFWGLFKPQPETGTSTNLIY